MEIIIDRRDAFVSAKMSPQGPVVNCCVGTESNFDSNPCRVGTVLNNVGTEDDFDSATCRVGAVLNYQGCKKRKDSKPKL